MAKRFGGKYSPNAGGAAEGEAFEGQCEAIRSDGTRCTNHAKEGTRYCGLHAKLAETDGMCKGHYADGRPCGNKAKEDSDYCGVHAKQEAHAE